MLRVLPFAVQQTMALNIDDASSIFSSALSDPSATTELQPSSTTTTHAISTDFPRDEDAHRDAYIGFNWAKYPGFQIPEHGKREWTSWIWKYEYRIQKTADGSIYWICRYCVEKKLPKPTQYKQSGGTHKPADHLRDQHCVGEHGVIQKKRKASIITNQSLLETGDDFYLADQVAKSGVYMLSSSSLK
jgi:hypothetical protein